MQQGGKIKYIDVGKMSQTEAIAVLNKCRAEIGQEPVKPVGWFFTLCLALGFMS